MHLRDTRHTFLQLRRRLTLAAVVAAGLGSTAAVSGRVSVTASVTEDELAPSSASATGLAASAYTQGGPKK